MSDKPNQFLNPHDLPVEKLMLSVTNAGVVQQIKALDAYWVEQRSLTIYERPPSASTTVIGAMDAWRARMEGYLEDLKWLLGLEHYRFWSTILYHPNTMDMLVSFLQESNPPYMPLYECRLVQKLYEDIRKLVFVVFSRLITNKESKSHWMSKEYLRDLIYDKFIFTIPILWDICLVYGADNTQHVSKLLTSVFTLQPRYLADLDAAIAFVKEAFKYIILQVNKNYDSAEPPNLPETFQGFGEICRPSQSNSKDEKLTFQGLRDLVVHLLDTTLTIRIFLEAYPHCVPVFRKRGFVLSIVQLYEYAIPHLYEKLEELGDRATVTHTAVLGHIDAARAELVDVFREILAAPKNAIFSDEANLESHVEEYLATMMDGLSERLLIQDYHACYPVSEDLDMLKQAYPSIDPVKTDFILQAIYSNLDEPVPEPSTEHLTNGHTESTSTDSSPSNKDVDIPDHIRQESLISEVKDIFPDLGDGFVLKCLEHFGMNSERVIGCILEDNLPGSLRSVDRSLPIIPEDVVDKKFLETGIERLNVFDGDQFDIMTRDDVDLTKIHKGKKKEKYRDLKDMLNDKSDVKKMVDIYSKYNLVCDETDMYSDEYDDTYDAEPAAARGADADDDLGRPFVTPRALAPHVRYEEESEDEPEPAAEKAAAAGTSAAGAGGRNRLDFCQNPEEVRARREAAYRAKQGRGHRPPPNRNADVAGKPRGQGQEKEVLHNRDKKEKSKSSRGNHSRRSGAQWKRTQGMVPS